MLNQEPFTQHKLALRPGRIENNYIRQKQKMDQVQNVQIENHDNFQQQMDDNVQLENNGNIQQKNRNNVLENKDDVQKEKNQNNQKEVSFRQLFRFAQKLDYLLIIIGSIMACLSGASFPAFSYLMGSMLNSFNMQDSAAIVEKCKEIMVQFIIVGCIAFLSNWVMLTSWAITGQRQTIKCKKAYLQSLLKQQIAFYDKNNQTQLTNKFLSDTYSYQGAIGQKISTIISTLSTLVSGFVFAFVTGWLMTLVIMVTVPIIGLCGLLYIKIIYINDKDKKQKYSIAAGLAQQALYSIKTVKQFNAQQFQLNNYTDSLGKLSKKYIIYAAMATAGIFAIILISYSLGIWYGVQCIIGSSSCPSHISLQDYSAGNVLAIFFSLLIGGQNCSQLTPCLKKIAQGKKSAESIYQIIDKIPQIKSGSEIIQDFKGQIIFQNVSFSYPKDKTTKILNNLTLNFNLKKIGLIGQSGCGKSTILQLIMRYYDPNEGKITVDGKDLKSLNLQWWRGIIGYVGQEPVLFYGTIKDNLLIAKSNANQQQLKNCLQKAKAWDFVKSFKQRLDTFVGGGGSQLSGGQKQRIAIARALLKKPKILLLDEATSALDKKNEHLIQKTLDDISDDLKTITVTHMPETLRKSDIIYKLNKGLCERSGNFKELFPQIQQRYIYQFQDSQQGQNIQDVLNLQQQERQTQVQTNIQQSENNEDKESIKQQFSVLKRIFSYGKQKKKLYILGVICAMGNGVIFPLFSIFLSQIFVSMLLIDNDPHNSKQIQKINNVALIFLLLGILAFLLHTAQSVSFTLVGETITKKLRIKVYHKMLKMKIKWFDQEKNNPGALSSKLSTDCEIVNGVISSIASVIIQNISTLLSGLIISFLYQWRISLLALGLLPLIVLTGMAQMQFSEGFSNKSDQSSKQSSKLLSQSLIHIRTVISFNYQKDLLFKYTDKIQKSYKQSIKKGFMAGFFFGGSQLILFITFGILFYVGAILLRQYPTQVTIQKVFTGVYALIIAGVTIGNNAHFMPDAGACKNSAIQLFNIIDDQDQDQMQIRQKSKMLTLTTLGNIEFKDVSFKYQNRIQKVLSDLNMKIQIGKKTAFVGSSGCGKSTVLQLLLRFYQPCSGQININDINIKDYCIHNLRKTLIFISQQPVLFNGSIQQNIKYNLIQTKIAKQKILEVAQMSCTLDFLVGKRNFNRSMPTQICLLPQQSKHNIEQFYKQIQFNDSNVGFRGSKISGGQKQRVSIARALLRYPRILLLDQATSALDSKNQEKVQHALNQLMRDKTIISVAHRINTIKNFDKILVFEKGKIIQSGNYEQLLKLRGAFYQLNSIKTG